MSIPQWTRRFVLLLVAAIPAAASAAEFSSYSGVELYGRFCASCHGPEGEGDGPVASFLNIKAPDLTRIATRHEGKFPTDRIRKIIDGRETIRPHGPREMPVWGWEFFFEEGGFRERDARAARQRTDETITRLVEHLRSIQKP